MDDAEGKLKDGWPAPLVKFLRGQIDEQAVMAATATRGQMSEAHCYLGLDELVRGHPDLARTHFEWFEQNGNRNFIEYAISLGELRRLTDKGTSPAQ